MKKLSLKMQLFHTHLMLLLFFIFTEVCDPCPSHGICYEGKLECTSGYTRHGRSCLEDGSINEMAKNLVSEHLSWGYFLIIT